MTAPFKYAHAVHADWTQAAQACMAQLGAIPAGATLGFLYVADAFVGELDAILAFFRSATGVPHWTGSVGVGVCVTGVEYLEAPAMAVMLGEFDPADFCMLPVRPRRRTSGRSPPMPILQSSMATRRILVSRN